MNTETKKWYLSKGVWIGVCVFLIGAIEVVQALIQSGDFSVLGILTAVGGVLKVAERVLGSNKQIIL